MYGLIAKLLRYRNRNFPKILLYHRVYESRTDLLHSGMGVSYDRFLRQLLFLKKHYEILPLQELLDNWRKNIHKPYQISITFDDGYKDIYTLVYPILKKFNIKISVFLTLNPLRTREYLWYDAFFNLKKIYKLDNLVEILSKLFCIDFDSFADIFSYIKYNFNSYQKIVDIYRFLGVEYPKDEDSVLYLNWQDLRSMEDLVSFGMHGVYHNCFSTIGKPLAENEVKDSKLYLEERGSYCRNIFSFPFGHKKDVLDLSEVFYGENIEFALSAEPGFLKQSSDKFFIPRIGVEDWNVNIFSLLIEKF